MPTVVNEEQENTVNTEKDVQDKSINISLQEEEKQNTVVAEHSQENDLSSTTPFTEVRTTKGTEPLFLKSVSVWINKPHVINRRLCGSKILIVQRLETKVDALRELNALREFDGDSSKQTGSASDFRDLSEEKSNFVLLLREQIPKSQYFPNIFEAILFDQQGKSVRFIPLKTNLNSESDSAKLQTVELEYSLQFLQLDKNAPEWAEINEIKLSWLKDTGNEKNVRRQINSQWLKTILLSKLVNWSQINDLSTSVTSLQLVPVDKYKDTYVRLKNMYGRDLVKNWTERTDPEKFVYEDIAIATYLMLIWEDDRKKNNLEQKQSFVDLGCGNGLLVYILTMEGHKGLGIDLRKRKIWDTFGPDFDLREQSISPSSDHLFPEYDWIIGNHSDELTPWIPVIAARSAYKCNFFVLPCCHHDFVGKFMFCPTKKPNKSQYGSYLDYVKEIAYSCGFHPESDTLRIPSTKRICFIGRERSYKEADEKYVDLERQAYIDKRIAQSKLTTGKRKSLSCQKDDGTNRVVPLDAKAHNNAESSGGVSMRQDSTECDSGLGSLESQLSVEYDTGTESGIDAKILTDKLSSFPSDVEIEDHAIDSDMSESDKFVSETVFDLDAKRKFCSQSESVAETGTNSKNTESSSMYMAKKHKGDNAVSTSGQWVEGFKPRVETAMRNCQTVPEETKRKIVDVVFNKVLNWDSETKADLGEGRSWRKGGAVPLQDIVPFLDKATMFDLKAECGGLQTLLRNHSHVFQVTGGTVRLRDFTDANPFQGCRPRKNREGRDRRKTLQCWFYTHHPDGCPREKEACLFAHGAQELK